MQVGFFSSEFLSSSALFLGALMLHRTVY